MLQTGTPHSGSSLSQFSGPALYSSAEVVLKALLDMDTDVSLLVGPPVEPFAAVFERGGAVDARDLLQRHEVTLIPTPDGARAVSLAHRCAAAGEVAMALVPNVQLDRTMPALSRLGSDRFGEGGAMCVMLVDNPRRSPVTSPRVAAQRLGWPCVEPADLQQLHDHLDKAVKLSRARRLPAAVVVHISLLRMVDTLEAKPNRKAGTVDEMLARRKQRRAPRIGEGEVVRMGRRFELNPALSMPSPGEKEAIGFLTVGPARSAMLHILHILNLRGRVPVLQLGLLEPIDAPAVERLLTRCEQVMVIEPRPGEVEGNILTVAEGMRRRGDSPAPVWGRVVPGNGGQPTLMRSDEDLHPSVLVRRIVHLLGTLRPLGELTARLTPDPEPIALSLTERGADVGFSGALVRVRSLLEETDRWLRDPERRTADEQPTTPRTLVIEGVEPDQSAGDRVAVEIWEQSRFEQEGLSALRDAAWSEMSTMLVILASSAAVVDDLERLTRGAVPGTRVGRTRIDRVDLSDPASIQIQLRDSALFDGLSIVLVSEATPSQFDLRAIEESLEEVDRLGFQPRERIVRSIDRICSLAEHEESPSTLADSEIRSSFTIDALPARLRSRFGVRIRPLIEQIDIVRTRAPVVGGPFGSMRLAPPTPVHASQPTWRAHLAGYRGPGPGLAASVLCEAGRLMGYSVRCVYEPTIIGPGRRAWAQVLYTRPGRADVATVLSGAAPYGEADLLVGLDAVEAVRAVGPDTHLRIAWRERTAAVINMGGFERAAPAIELRERIREALSTACTEDRSWFADIAEACRAVFHTDRVTDLAVLGAAYQLALIPVSLDAIEDAMLRIESRGYGRVREAFEFGRRFGAGERLVRPSPQPVRQERVQHAARRMDLWLRRAKRRGRHQARQFAELIRRSLEAMPGLAETDPGRRALRDFTHAVYRCFLWGGHDEAERFADLLIRLYHADRGDRGRALTRNAVRPLAEVMLIRDLIYQATLVVSAEQRQNLRRHLNVKHARGDQVERRYLTRVEIVGFRRRLRADVRSSDWPARLSASMRRVIPRRLRGSSSERERRDFIINLIVRAASHAAHEYDRWHQVLQSLHDCAVDGRLRNMSVEDLGDLVVESEHDIEAAVPVTG